MTLRCFSVRQAEATEKSGLRLLSVFPMGGVLYKKRTHVTLLL